MKTARIRIQIDLEIDCPLEHFNENAAGFEETVRFFFEENHCVENETERALELLQQARARAELKAHAENPRMPSECGVCVTCHGADVTLLKIEDASALE